MCARTHKDHIVPLVVFVLAACERCAQRAHCVRAPCALALCLPYCPRSIQLCLCVRAHTKATSCPWSCSCSQLASAGHADLRVVWLRMNSTVPAEAAERSSACVSCMAGKFSESVAAENGATRRTATRERIRRFRVRWARTHAKPVYPALTRTLPASRCLARQALLKLLFDGSCWSSTAFAEAAAESFLLRLECFC